MGATTENSAAQNSQAKHSTSKNSAYHSKTGAGQIHDSDAPEAEPEPRWPALVSGLAVGLLYMALPEKLSAGPNWLLGLLICALLIPTVLTRRAGLHFLNARFGQLLNVVITGFMIWSVFQLVRLLVTGQEKDAVLLLRAAGALWLTNILVFAGWYWRLDAGGPHERDNRVGHCTGAFLFPQMTLAPEVNAANGDANWSPMFIDYLFLAFNTSTALSPTDAPVLSRWAKGLVMLQALISLTIIVILAARAVNILPGAS